MAGRAVTFVWRESFGGLSLRFIIKIVRCSLRRILSFHLLSSRSLFQCTAGLGTVANCPCLPPCSFCGHDVCVQLGAGEQEEGGDGQNGGAETARGADFLINLVDFILVFPIHRRCRSRAVDRARAFAGSHPPSIVPPRPQLIDDGSSPSR